VLNDKKINFEFTLDITDTIFTLTRNNSFYIENVSNIVSKMVIIKESKSINLNQVSIILKHMKIKNLNFFLIDSRLNTISFVNTNNGCEINYIEMNTEQFIAYLNCRDNNFLDYNKNSIYIVRGGNYISIKNLFLTINEYRVNLVRWRGSKSPYVKSFGF